jgi:pilus assembly protein CpaB
MPVDRINSVSGLLQPGDLIDLYVSFDYQRRTITAPLLQGVLVLATDTRTRTDAQPVNSASPSSYGTVTLDAAPEDAVKLVAARQSGTLTAVLRGTSDQHSTTRAARGDLASLLGINRPPPRRSTKAPVIYGNHTATALSRLSPVAGVTQGSGLFDLPQMQALVSAWAQAQPLSDDRLASSPEPAEDTAPVARSTEEQAGLPGPLPEAP